MAVYKCKCYFYLTFILAGVPYGMENELNIYLNKKYQEISKFLRFGRLPVHELLKIETALYGEKLGYEVRVEFKVDRNKRIDVVWLKDGVIEVAIEIDEGVNTRALWKMNFCNAKKKICIFFDMKKMSLRKVENWDFTNYIVIKLFSNL